MYTLNCKIMYFLDKKMTKNFILYILLLSYILFAGGCMIIQEVWAEHHLLDRGSACQGWIVRFSCSFLQFSSK